MGTYYVTKESQEIAGCRLIRYGIGCRWREILGLSHNRQAVEWLVERCNTLELDPIHLEDVVQDFLWEQGEPMRTIAGWGEKNGRETTGVPIPVPAGGGRVAVHCPQ